MPSPSTNACQPAPSFTLAPRRTRSVVDWASRANASSLTRSWRSRAFHSHVTGDDDGIAVSAAFTDAGSKAHAMAANRSVRVNDGMGSSSGMCAGSAPWPCAALIQIKPVPGEVDAMAPFDFDQSQPATHRSRFAHRPKAAIREGDTTMKCGTRALAVTAVLTLVLAGCSGDDGAKPVATAAASETGGSLKGDFRPPPGEPINA